MKIKLEKVKIPENETHYRYSDIHMEDGLHVNLHKYYSVYETECFHYVVDEWGFHQIKLWNIPALIKINKEIIVKKVMKKALRSYCYESKEKALHSFIMRKKKQLLHAETAQSKATLSLLKVQKMKPDEIGESVNCGLDEHLGSFIFD